MENIKMTTNTVRFHRVFTAPPERLYRAFLDAAATAKWLPPHGFTCTVHHLDAKVGGTFKMSFTNFSTEQSHSFSGEYLELAPNERIRYSDVFDDPNLPGTMQTTVTLKAVFCGRHSRSHPCRILLSRLATIARTACPTRRTRN
jgi:uncharacterized protein YndB with AHSA1/START domain